MQHHAFAIEAEAEQGIQYAQAWIERELSMKMEGNPDIAVLKYELLSVADARQISELAAGTPFIGEHKVLIIAASHIYREAQNAFLKLFEEPPRGTLLFFIIPTFGGLLSTLRSRMQILSNEIDNKDKETKIPEIAEVFLKGTGEKRSKLIKTLTSVSDEESRRELRNEAIAIVNGVEAAAYSQLQKDKTRDVTSLLSDVAILRNYLYDRSAPVRMILEHLALVTPKDLL